MIGLIWMLTFGGMQWRIAGLLSGIPFTTLHTSFARWTRLGLWRRLGQRWPSTGASPAATRSCPRRWWSTAARSAPPRAPGREASTAASWSRASSSSSASDKHGSLLDLELRPANTDDRAGILPTLPRLAALGFQGDLLGDSGFKGAPFAAAALAHDIHVAVSPGGTREGRFLPSGIRWVVERLFAWLQPLSPPQHRL